MRLLILAIMMCVGTFLFTAFALNLVDYKPGDLGLGVATSSHTESFDGLQINQTEGGYDKVLPVIRKFNKNKWCLLVGNSQLHAINYFTNSDHLAVYHMNHFMFEASVNTRAIQLSSPNINFQELLLYYLTLKNLGHKPEWLIIGCTYRTFQLTSLRDNFQEQLKDLDFNEFELRAEVKKYYAEQHVAISVNKNRPAETGTLQEKIETGITSQLEQNWEAYRYRGNVRSKLKVLPGIAFRSLFEKHSFYQGSQTTENLNMTFLQQIIDLAEKDGVKVLLYQPPHPQSSEPFQYDKKKYEACFRRISKIADEKDHVFFESYETIVPLSLWGMNSSGRLDIFHFKGEGHLILAENIVQFLSLHNSGRYALQ